MTQEVQSEPRLLAPESPGETTRSLEAKPRVNYPSSGTITSHQSSILPRLLNYVFQIQIQIAALFVDKTTYP